MNRLRCHCVTCHFRGARGPFVVHPGTRVYAHDRCPSCGSSDVEVMTPEWREDLLERGERSAIREQGAQAQAEAA